MKVFYPGTSQEHTVYTTSKTSSNSLIFQPVKSFPEKVVYKSISGASDSNKIIYPVRTFASRLKKDSVPGGGGSSSKISVTVGNTISIKDLDLSKLPIISLSSVT